MTFMKLCSEIIPSWYARCDPVRREVVDLHPADLQHENHIRIYMDVYWMPFAVTGNGCEQVAQPGGGRPRL